MQVTWFVLKSAIITYNYYQTYWEGQADEPINALSRDMYSEL